MNWDSITLYVLAGFGVVLLVLGQLRDVLAKVTELVSAWREFRNSIRRSPDPQGAPSAPEQGGDDS